MNETHKAIALAIGGFALYSATDIIGKILIARYTAFELTFWYGIVLLFSLILMAPFLGGWHTTLKTKKLKWHLARAALTGFIPILNIYAVAHMQLVNFYTIVFLSPFITAILATPFIKEHVPPKRWIIIIGGFTGVALGLRPDLNGITLPVLAVMTTAVTFSLRSLIVPKMGKQETLLSLGFYPAIGIIICGALGPIQDGFNPMAISDALLIGMAGILGAIGLIINSVAFRMAPAAAIAPTHYTQMIWGVIFGYLVFNDIPDLWMIIGATVVCGCGIALIFTEGKGIRFPRRRI